MSTQTSVSLSELIDRVRENADIVSASFRHTDASLTRYINQEIAVLHDLMMDKWEDIFVIELNQNITGSRFILPTDFSHLRGVHSVINSNDVVPLGEIGFEEIGQYAAASSVFVPFTGFLPVYNLAGLNGNATLCFYPTSVQPGNVRITYVPCAPVLVSGSSDTLGLPYVQNGFEELVVLGAAIKALERDEMDHTSQVLRKAEVTNRIQRAAANRSATGNETIRHIPRGWDWDW